MIVCNQNFDNETISQIQALSDNNPETSLSQLARQVCEMLDWRRPNGDLKEGSCRKALHKLNKEGHLELPESDQQWAFQNPNPPAETLPEGCAEFEGTLEQLGDVRLELIPTRYYKNYMIWRDMMDVAHPLGRGPLAGGRLRYLVTSSEQGIVGALAFSSPAFHLKCRARFIGWTPEAREHNRERIVQNSRFLILPQVQVPNLASHVLGKAARRVPEHWREKYGYQAVMLETFVNPGHHDGSCYLAAGWKEVGLTTGRGRGSEEEQKVPKRVYLRPLDPDWQEELCRRPDGTSEVLEPEEPSDWAERELNSLDLGDKRRNVRAATVLRQFYSKPLAPIPAACCGEANIRGAYRFFNNSETSMDKILQAHYDTTLERAAEHDLVLAVQDSTSLNYTGLDSNEDLGRINNCDKDAVGLHMHDTMLFTPTGVPQGLLDVQMWTRDWEGRDKTKMKQTPIEDKESYKWIRSYEALCEAQRKHPGTRFISIGDREADIWDLLVRARDTEEAAGLLVRSAKSRQRRTTGGKKLWKVMAQKPVEAELEVHVPARKNQPGRDVVVELRSSKVELVPPKHKKDMGTVQMWAVYVVEKDSDPESDRLEWMLLTTEPTETTDDAITRVEQYRGRWGIERYHRCLKSGCRMEDRQLQSGEGLQTCLAMDMIVAFRIYRLTMLGREVPDMSCDVYFSECEWKALVTYVEKDPEAAEGPPPTLQEAVEMVGLMGGYRKRKRPPGDQTMWRGIQRLADMAEFRRIVYNNEDATKPLGPL